MDIPGWVTELVRQFPVLAVVLLVVWYAVRYIREQHAAHLARLEVAHAQHLKSKDDAQKALLLAFKKERKQMAEMIADLRRQRDILADQLRQAGEGGGP